MAQEAAANLDQVAEGDTSAEVRAGDDEEGKVAGRGLRGIWVVGGGVRNVVDQVMVCSGQRDEVRSYDHDDRTVGIRELLRSGVRDLWQDDRGEGGGI